LSISVLAFAGLLLLAVRFRLSVKLTKLRLIYSVSTGASYAITTTPDRMRDKLFKACRNIPKRQNVTQFLDKTVSFEVKLITLAR
jgi:hypothetical protein